MFLILSAPTGIVFSPKYTVKRKLINFPNIFYKIEGGSSALTLKSNFGLVQDDIKNMALKSGAIVINPTDFLCKDNFCPNKDSEGNFIYMDENHLRASFVKDNADFIDSTVQSSLSNSE